ncbi:DUF2789 domain-containing protein [Pseudomonas cavernae]|uniref:DUF2789 domain-containing protein n=1 Tax=Pseudomonas cavernae TaxID=2320867 RepID=A0A385Z5R6_9PSED|nr:DUF2789 domain-containing protein [Pseudomonas cavernae]AYC34124.1 DUF2789 domain-containing protein [Pseudomonas cavernae]
MDTSIPHSLANLFEQLGLASDPASIDAFIDSHRLKPGQSIIHGEFWTPAQASFLRESLQDDSDWAEEVDELAVRLGAS